MTGLFTNHTQFLKYSNGQKIYFYCLNEHGDMDKNVYLDLKKKKRRRKAKWDNRKTKRCDNVLWKIEV